MGLPKKVDYLIIGSGPAGCVLARKLSDDFGYSVLLLEAGAYRDNDPNILNSISSIQNELYANYFWQETTTPQEGLNNRLIQYTSGRLFGGGSSVNGSQWVRASVENYQQWQALTGDPSWSVDNIVNLFKQIEQYHGTTENPAARGFNGLMTVRQTDEPITDPVANKITTSFQQAAIQAGINIPIIDDYNTQPAGPNPSNAAFSAWQVTQSVNPDNFGTRVNASIAYLDDVIELNDDQNPDYAVGKNGRKLYVLFKTTGLKIRFKGNKAVGVSYTHDGQCKTTCARKVIVSAGINSPWILQVSGVGPADVLESVGVPVVVNNQQIGKNLQDHTFFTASFLRANNDAPLDPKTNLVGGVFYPDPRPGQDLNIRKFEAQGFFVTGAPVFVVVFYLIKPLSAGTINIFADDPLQVPLPDPNYLTNPDDLAALIAGVQTYLRNFTVDLITKDPTYTPLGLPLATIDNTAALTTFLRQNLNRGFHYGCSVKMATQAQGGAVDGSGRVYGARNLIVADNCLQPVLGDNNTQANAYLIGFKIAQDLIAERH